MKAIARALGWVACLAAALGFSFLVTGCGGGSSGGPGAATGEVALSGTIGSVAAEAGGAQEMPRSGGFRVYASGSSGSMHDADADDEGHFRLMLPPDDSYVMGFEHRDMMSMHFSGYMAFGCGDGESDHFFVSGRERAVDMGRVTVGRDGRFARPERNPLDQMDRDGDGVPDVRDPDTRCGDLGDRDHDGFYDDDMDHDGHHDDDMDRDGHHDCETGGMGHDDEEDGCSDQP